MSKKSKSIRVVSREEIQEQQQRPKRKPRARSREIVFRPFEDALRGVTVKEAK